MVVSAFLLSSLGKYLSSGLVRRQRSWVLVGSPLETNTVSKEIECGSSLLQSRVTLTRIDQLSAVIEEQSFSSRSIAVGSMEGSTKRESEKLLQMREKGERVVPLLTWCEEELQRIPPELVHSEWLLQAEGFGLRPGSISWRVKRIGDFIGALLLIAVTTPLLAVGALLVWAEDRGPVFYHQVRSGLYGRPIRIWKLRSMRTDAEEAGAQWARKGDARVTRVGRVLRATRIDELPQLFSVINGDLSLIGPRPERPEIEEELERCIPNYRIRHWIRPGLSGWAQVCYPYGASIADSRAKLSYDLYYLRNSDLFLDILITLKTIRLVACAKGASPLIDRQ